MKAHRGNGGTLALILAAGALAGAGPALAAGEKISDRAVHIGFITDMSGVYADVDGSGGATAIQMAIDDFREKNPGFLVDLMTADHQNKADIASAKAREWFDQRGLDMLVGGTNSGAALAMASIAAEHKKPYFVLGAGSSKLTNESCTPYTIHYAYDTYALANVTGSKVIQSGGKSWFFLTADYAFGKSLEADTTAVVLKQGGTVVGSVRHPLNASDFSSFLLQAQGSGAKVLGFANAGMDLVNGVKAANDFGISGQMKLVGLLTFISDIHALGLEATQGMVFTDGWVWNQSPEARAWARRYFDKVKRMPTMVQAGDYSATMQYLLAVKAAGTDDGDAVMAQLRKTRIDDMFTHGGLIRADGRMVHDMRLVQVKTPAEKKEAWDYEKLIEVVPGDQAYAPLSESRCPLVKH